MWSEIKASLQNAIFYPVLAFSLLAIYSIFILRERKWNCSGPTNDKILSIVEGLQMRGVYNSADLKGASKHFLYSLEVLPGGRVRRQISNLSWRPFFVTLYAFPGSEYDLPDEELLKYAERYVVRNPETDQKIDSGYGFGCGTGLILSLIRPYESFVDTVDRVDILPFLFPHELKKLIGRKKAEEERDGESNENDVLTFQLYLPVSDYFTGASHRVFSSEMVTSRREIIDLFKD